MPEKMGTLGRLLYPKAPKSLLLGVVSRHVYD